MKRMNKLREDEPQRHEGTEGLHPNDGKDGDETHQEFPFVLSVSIREIRG